MKTLLDNENYKYWFLDKSQYRNGELIVDIVRGCATDTTQDLDIFQKKKIENVKEIKIDPNSKVYRIIFSDVLSLQLYDELVHYPKESEEHSKTVIRKHKDSNYLDYVKEKTSLFESTPGELFHFSIWTSEECFHIISRESPSIEMKNTS